MAKSPSVYNPNWTPTPSAAERFAGPELSLAIELPRDYVPKNPLPKWGGDGPPINLKDFPPSEDE